MVDQQNIPTVLRPRRQFVTWRYERKNGRMTKVPYQPGCYRRASTTDPHTWGSFNAALDALEPNLDGIGFVVTPEDPFCGVDLDHCRTPATGVVAAWAQGILDRLDSFAEVTPSGEGVRVWIRASIPWRRHRRGGFGPVGGGVIEVYDRNRYFTVSGRHVAGTPRTIEERQPELKALFEELLPLPGVRKQTAAPPAMEVDLDDRALISRARQSRNGRRFSQLYDHGDWRGAGYPSQSEADLALCGTLAFFTGPDPARIERLFRGSALCRPKWECRRDYRERTITLALEGRTSFYRSPAPTGQQGSPGPLLPAVTRGRRDL